MSDTGCDRVAAFDVDGTLTTRDCVIPFVRRIAGTAHVAGRIARRPVVAVRTGITGGRDGVKALTAAAAFGGRPEVDVRAEGRRFAAEVYEHRMRSDTVQNLRRHVDDGDVVVLVSASFEVYLDPLGELLGLPPGRSGVIGTRLAVDGDGVLTGELDGPNCRGPEKVVRLHAWLAERGVARRDVHVTAYGDSPGDRELLADADEPHWVSS